MSCVLSGFLVVSGGRVNPMLFFHYVHKHKSELAFGHSAMSAPSVIHGETTILERQVRRQPSGDCKKKNTGVRGRRVSQ